MVPRRSYVVPCLEWIDLLNKNLLDNNVIPKSMIEWIKKGFKESE